MAAGICETVQAERNPNHYASTLAALRAKCPACVPEDRWRQAIEDATAFVSEWGERAQAFGWTARELFGPSGAGATSGQLFAIVARRRHGADLAAPRSPGDRVDGGGGCNALS